MRAATHRPPVRFLWPVASLVRMTSSTRTAAVAATEVSGRKQHRHGRKKFGVPPFRDGGATSETAFSKASEVHATYLNTHPQSTTNSTIGATGVSEVRCPAGLFTIFPAPRDS